MKLTLDNNKKNPELVWHLDFGRFRAGLNLATFFYAEPKEGLMYGGWKCEHRIREVVRPGLKVSVRFTEEPDKEAKFATVFGYAEGQAHMLLAAFKTMLCFHHHVQGRNSAGLAKLWYQSPLGNQVASREALFLFLMVEGPRV